MHDPRRPHRRCAGARSRRQGHGVARSEAADEHHDRNGRHLDLGAGGAHDAPFWADDHCHTTTAPPAVTSTGVPTTPAPGPSVREELAALRIDDSRSAPDGYSRDFSPTWLDLDGNGSDARDDTLSAASLGPVQRSGCEVIGGRWLSIYDGVAVTDPSGLDVDHVVALGEAWRSGAHAWEADHRARFANDLDDPDHLIAVTASTNRSKGDSPPDAWRPPRQDSWCRYAAAWTGIKVRWELTATTSERDALGQMLGTC